LLTHAWLFPGQGSQYTQMGRHIWTHSLSNDVLSMAESISGLPLRRVMDQGPEAALRSPEILEPCIVALQAAYVLLLQSKGMQPDAVAGYSLGEIGALYCAGSLTLLDALMLASARGKILAAKVRQGPWLTRAAHFTNEPQALPLDGTGNIFVAAYNTPRDFTITGAAADIQAVEQMLSKRTTLLSPVAIAGPWHSPLAEDSARETAYLLRSVEIRRPLFPVCLGTSGEFETEPESIRGSLSRQIDHPVFWRAALERLWQAGVRSTLEMGPGRVLTSFVRANWVQREYSAQFLERQGGRAIDFTTLKPVLEKEKDWTKSA
jgi:[acyl-carrier-protein] S-malonyltransferase